MNILYLNHYAGGPAWGMEYRPFYLAREWVRAGHSVHMVAATFSHVRAHQPQAGEETVEGIHYHWVPAPAYQGNGVGRVRNIWAFLKAVWAQAPRMAQQFKPDVVIASSTYPMDIWVARRLARLATAKLVFEVHDLWPLSPIELNGMSRWHPFIMLCQAAEDAGYRHADVVVSMLPKVHDHMAGRGLDLRKLHIVPNGVDPAEWQSEPEALRADVASAVQANRQAGRVLVGYAGSMGRPNALDVLLDAAALLRNDNVGFIMVGDGHDRQALVRRIESEGLSNVTWLPPAPKAQVPALLAAVDVAYLGWQKVPIYRFGIAPNKLMDYMMAARPVLHSVQAGNDPVMESGCGLTVPPQDALAVANAVRQFAAMPTGERQRMGLRGRAFVEQHHTYPVLAKRFLQAVSA